jgi:hypothetical protein
MTTLPSQWWCGVPPVRLWVKEWRLGIGLSAFGYRPAKTEDGYRSSAVGYRPAKTEKLVLKTCYRLEADLMSFFTSFT